MKATLEQIAEKIKDAKIIAAFGHQRTDCDCVASLLAFGLMCEQLGKKVELFVDSELDDRVMHLPGIEKINRTSSFKQADLLISLDNATAERLGKFRTEFMLHNNTARIDHHGNTEPYAKLDYVDSSLPANCLILKKLQKLLGVKDTPDINFLLLSGTMTDTSCFRFNSTNAKTLKIAAEMVDNLNQDYTNVVYPLFNSVSKQQRMLEAYAITNAKFFHNDEIVLSYFSQDELKKLGATIPMLSSRAHFLLDINTVKIAISVTEEEKGRFLVSYYSKGKIDISTCARAFGGGGHTGAAGCKLIGKESQVLNRLVKEAEKCLEKYNAE